MNLILLGAPGAGKGTQAEALCGKLAIPAVSTGNMLREAIASGTEMGRLAKGYVDSGSLVPDDIVIGVIKERLAQSDCANGFILDGFPRTVPQAEALDAMGVRIDRVLSLEVADQTIVSRLSGRRVCPKCGASYHIEYKKPAADGVCDKCGAKLTRRDDDSPETVLERLRNYHRQTEPLKDYYARTGKLVTVNGCEAVADTTAAMFAALGLQPE